MSEDKNIKIAKLIGLEKKTREAKTEDELNFVIVNETRQLVCLLYTSDAADEP